jgi:S1-C subfamily serine protease
MNQGNSGGALLNLLGQFVGMPTSVLRQTRSGAPVEGIGFALPSDRLMAIALRIISEGRSYPRPTMGLEHLDLTPELVARFRVGIDQGALVTEVAAGSPAAAAGIARGDVITKIGDTPVDRDNPFLNAMGLYSPGQSVRVVLNRNGRIIEAEVRLGTRS